MFCQDKKPYLEIFLDDTGVDEIKNISLFCKISFYLLQGLSLPYAVLILISAAAALIALVKENKVCRSGMGTMFMSILVVDMLNGVMCLRLFEQYTFRQKIRFHSDNVALAMGWIEYFLIYVGWHLKFILIIYNLHKYLKNSVALCWNPFFNVNRNRAICTPKTTLIILACIILLSLTEMFIMMKEVQNMNFKVITPFLGILNLVQCCFSAFIGVLYFTVSIDADAIWLDRFIVGGIGLNCVSTTFSNAFMLYGDMSCVFKYSPPKYMYPVCYSTFARFISYTDSFLFSIILFRSSKIRYSLKRAIKDVCCRSFVTDEVSECGVADISYLIGSSTLHHVNNNVIKR